MKPKFLSRVFAAAVVLAVALESWLPAQAVAGGSIEGTITVNGRDASGGVFWIVALPANSPQPVTVETARSYAIKTDAPGHFRIDGLAAGSYLVALVESPDALAVPAQATVRVKLANGSVFSWPAYSVQIDANAAAPQTVAFQRKPYPDLPPGFSIPHTDAATSSTRRHAGPPAVRLVGAILAIGSALLLARAYGRKSVRS